MPTAPIEQMLAATAAERVRFLVPYTLAGVVVAFVASDGLGVGLSIPVVLYNVVAIAGLAALTLLRRRSFVDRLAHVALALTWTAPIGGTLVSEAFSGEASLHALLLIELCAAAIQLHTGLVVASLASATVFAAPLMLRDGGAEGPLNLAAVVGATTCSLLFHLLMKRSLVRAEAHRLAAAATARELAERVEELHRAEAERARLQAELVESSREAGRSDVATAVLHNVGNVLNSVNVSSMVIADVLATSRLNRMPAVAEMLREHRADLPGFLRDDPRGQVLPEYIIQLGDAVEQEKRALAAELQNLHRNIEHIKVIVQSQQSHVRDSAPSELFELGALVDDALGLTDLDRADHPIDVVRRYESPLAANLDRHKALQVVVNLLANAREAVLAAPSGRRQIVVQTARRGAGELAIEVTDTGCGIARGDLERIFALGFTTKPDGQGLGLHFSACAARELRGSLTATSGGPGQGATFVLTLPISAPTRAATRTQRR